MTTLDRVRRRRMEMDAEGNLYIKCICGESYYRERHPTCPHCGEPAPDPFAAFKDVLLSDQEIGERIRSGALDSGPTPNEPKPR